MPDTIPTNHAFKEVEAVDGQEFMLCNLTQMYPHTNPFGSAVNLVLTRCNLTNCDLPSGSVVNDCMRTQVSFCSHLHPKWIDKGLEVCATECEHMVDKTEVRVNTVLIDTIYEYEDKGVA